MSDEIVIRPARPEDYDRIAEVATQAWSHIFEVWKDLQRDAVGRVLEERRGEDTGAAVRRYCEANPDRVLVSEVGGLVVGFLTYRIDRERSRGEIVWNAVDREYRGRGIGTRQVEAVLDVFRSAGLRYADVTTNHDEGHAGARRQYEKAGFKPVFISLRYMLPLD